MMKSIALLENITWHKHIGRRITTSNLPFFASIRIDDDVDHEEKTANK